MSMALILWRILQRYVAQGSILLTDLTRSEGMTDWTPVSQVIGNIPIPAGGRGCCRRICRRNRLWRGIVYAGRRTGLWRRKRMPSRDCRARTDRLSLGPCAAYWILTCGLFCWAWWIVEAVFVKKLTSSSKGLLFVIFSIRLLFRWRFRQWDDARLNPWRDP